MVKNDWSFVGQNKSIQISEQKSNPDQSINLTSGLQDIKNLNLKKVKKQIKKSKMKINKVFGKFKTQEIHDSILRIRKAK